MADTSITAPPSGNLKRFLPLIIFLVLVAFLGIGLTLNPREVPSPLINKPVPQFKLPVLGAPNKLMGTQDLLGTVWMLNVWASWCVACRVEHPVLVELAKTNQVPIYGLNYKDKSPAAIAWLGNLAIRTPPRWLTATGWSALTSVCMVCRKLLLSTNKA